MIWVASTYSSITDYDDSVLSYTYDDAGNVITMNDYHSQVTAYEYDVRNWMTKLTAPGTNKVWNVTYRDNGQRSMVELPPGDLVAGAMYTTYSYDNRNRLTKIHHDDTSSLSTNGWIYRLDGNGNILRTGVSDAYSSDASGWDYAYDGRYRLTDAILRNGAGVPSMRFSYAYDAGDNLLTKEQVVYDEVMSDDFSDGDYTDDPTWTVTSGTWSASSNYLTDTATSAAVITKAQTEGDFEAWFSYAMYDIVYDPYRADVILRYVDANNLLKLRITPNKVQLIEVNSGTATTRAEDTDAGSDHAQWYEVYVRCEGDAVVVWRGGQDEGMRPLLEYDGLSVTTTSEWRFDVAAYTTFEFDDVLLLEEDTSSGDFSDDFSDGDFDGWGDRAGTWSAATGEMVNVYCLATSSEVYYEDHVRTIANSWWTDFWSAFADLL